MFKNTKIGTKLLMIGTLLILIPMIIVGIITMRIAGHALTEAVDEELRTRSSEIAKLVDDIMKEQLRFTIALSVVPEVVRAAGILDKAGNLDDRAGLKAVENYFETLLKTENLGKNVQLVGLVDLKGTISAASSSKYIGVRIPDRQYFQVARKGRSNIGEVAINKVTGNPFLSFAAPVRADDDRVIAVIMYIYDIGFLNSLIVDERIGKTGYAYMINKDGLLIAHPNPKHLLKTNLSKLKGMETFTHRMMNGESGVGRYVFENIEKTAGYAPVKSTGWSVGLTMPDSEYLAAVNTMVRYMAVIGFVAIVLAMVFFFIFSKFLVKRLQQGVVLAESMSVGDLTGEIKTDHGDEIGNLARSLNNMAGSMSRMIGRIHNGSSSLIVTSSELKNVSEVLLTGSSNTAGRANSVAAAAEEMNANIDSVAAAMEQASASVNNIAAAVEEMNVNVGDISERLGQTRDNTKRAVEVSESSSVQVNELKKAATEIESITETIYSIADKTSLLALNATIEAARAGDAGKGFAVVAGEIKVLAQQVSDSTGDIAGKINAIRETTETTIEGISEIVEVVSQASESVDSITTSMQQQNHATEEISENINQTSTGLQEINENVTQTSQAVAQVTSEISLVNQSANDISESIAEIEKSSEYLTRFAKELEQRVNEFQIKSSGFSSGPVKLAHSEWKKKLSDLIAGKAHFSEADVSSHHECEFGQWYFGEGKEKYNDSETFRQIDPDHEKIHSTARQITKLFNEGKTEEAIHLYSNFSEITDNLFELLEKLEEETSEG